MDELNNITNKLKRPYPQHRIEISTCLAALLHIINGITWSISLNEWQYLEKSGSIVVIVGILLAWSDVTGRIKLVKSRVKSETNSQIIASQQKEKGIINGYIQENKQGDLKASNEDIQKCLDAILNRIRTIEAIVLITGTFVWGYGSVVANHIYTFA
jgi:hypothetical protein